MKKTGIKAAIVVLLAVTVLAGEESKQQSLFCWQLRFWPERHLPVRAEAGVAVAAAVKDGDAEWPVDHEWAQTSNRHSRIIPGYRAHIARSPRAQIKTSGAVKADARADSVRASRAEAWQCRVEAAEAW